MRLACAAVVVAACADAGERALVEGLGIDGALVVRVTDGAGGPVVPARLMLFAGDEPVRFGELDFLDGTRQARGYCWLAPGALGTWDGLVLPWGEAVIRADAPCAPPAGVYRVWAWRGIEHEIWEGTVELGRRVARLDIALERAWRAEGALAADLHVHAAASPDSTVPAIIRAMTLAAAGVQVVALSDHNAVGDLDEEIRLAGLEGHLASIASTELSSDWAHVGVFPARAAPPPESETAGWSAKLVLTWARGQSGRPIVQVNHPRYRVYALFDLAGWDGVAWPPPFPLAFDAVEVLSGDTIFNAPGDRRLDEAVRDFYTMIDRGFAVTAVGNSDTHHLDGIRDGLTRNYVFVDEPVTAPFDEAAFVDAVRARRVVATSGPWLDVEVIGERAVGPGQTVRAAGGRVVVDVTVEQARFSRADRLRVLAGTGDGPRVVHDVAVPPGGRWRGRLAVDLGGRSGWVGVDVGGDAPLPVELTGNLHQQAGRPGTVPFALANPVLVEAVR